MKERLVYLLRLYITLLLIFETQRLLFMLVNMGHAGGAPFLCCLAAMWHGLRLDSVAASYIVVIPAIAVAVSFLTRKFSLRKIMSPYYMVAAVLLALVFVADTVLYFYWGAKMDANDLMYAAKPRDMLASVRWYIVVAGVLLVAGLVWHYFRRLLHPTPETLTAPKSRWYALTAIPLLGLVFLGMRGSVSQSTANPSYAYFSSHAFCNHAALNPFFNMTHSLFKMQDMENEFDFMTYEEAEGIAAPCFVTDNAITDTLLVCRRPDILMIVWEGGGWDMTMNDSVGPCLMRLADEGVCFTACYADNFRTDRGLVSLLSGWPGLPTASLMKMPDKCRALPGVAKCLSEEGYRCRFIYGGDVDFTNMRGYLMETGFDAVDGSEAFPSSRRLSSWGAPDAYTMLPSVTAAGDSPSFTVLLTLSSHEPWEVPFRRLADNRCNSFAYTDSCLGVLVDSLRLTPLWDSLLVVIVPDHGVPLSNSQSTSDPSVAHIPMVWTGGAVRNGKHSVDAMMMQSDLPATLLAQMGMDASRFVFSRNVLSPSYGSSRHFALHAFKNGCNYIDSAGITRMDCNDKSLQPVSGSHTEQQAEFVRALIQYIYQRTARL